MSHPEGVPSEDAERIPGGPVVFGTEPKQPEVNRAEQIYEEAAKRVATGDAADLDTALRQYHNQVVAETGDDQYSFDAFSNDVVERADSMLKAPPTETAPAANPVASPDQTSVPEVAINPAEQIMQAAAQDLAAGTMDETKLHDYQDQARAAGLPGNDLGIFATEIANRANTIRASQRPAEATPVSSAEQAVPEPAPEFASLGAAAAAKETAPGWTVPQPAANPLLRYPDRPIRRASAEERAQAERQYVDLRTKLEETQARLMKKFYRMPLKEREERVRADKEMQPLLKEFDHAKNVLTAQPERQSTVRQRRPLAGRQPAVDHKTVPPPEPKKDFLPAGTFDAPTPEEHEPGVLSVPDNLLGGMSSPETRAAAARLASETPAGPLRDQLEQAASAEPIVVPAVPVTPDMAARLTRHLRVEPKTETPPAAPLTAEPTPVREPVRPVSAVPENERADAARLEKLGAQAREAMAAETTPEAQPTMEAKEAKEKERTPQDRAVEDAREAYAKALLHERRWFSFGNKKELEKTARQYRQALDGAMRSELETLKLQYPNGPEQLDAAEQAEYTGQLLEASLKYRFEEEAKFRDALVEPGRKDRMEKFRVGLRKHWKARLVAGVALGFTPFGIAFSAATWANNIDAATRGIGKWAGKKWGASQELTEDRVQKMDSREEIERRLAAHTFDVVEYGEMKAAKAGTKKKGSKEAPEAVAATRTRDLLHKRYGELIRAEREQQIEQMFKEGRPVDEVVEHVVAGSLDSGRALHGAYHERIHRNKNMAKLRAVSSVAGGALVGTVANEVGHHIWKSDAVQGSMRGAKEWLGDLFNHAPDVKAGHPGGSLGDAYRDVADAARTPNWAGIERPVDGVGLHPGLEQAATETVAVSAIETARLGDSVWTMAERYVGEHAAGLSEEQKTWLIDSVKDAVAKDPGRFGLENIDRIAVGQTVDFSQAGLSLDALTDQAKHLSASTLESIHQNLTEKATEEATQAAVTASAPVPPAGQYFPADADNSEYFAPVAETVTPVTTPAVEHVVAAPVAETISQQIPETLTITPDVIRDFDTYRTVALNVPEAAMGQFRQSLEAITLQRGLEIGPIENALRGLPDVNNTQEELMSTALHRLAKSLMGAGHAPNQSMAAGLEWIRVSRQ